MFNIQGSELIFLLLVALIVLGPEKLPDAMRRFGKAYSEFKKMANGFQGELRSALDEPMRELRDTADVMMKAAQFDVDVAGKSTATGATTTSTGSETPTTSTSTTDTTSSEGTAARDAQGRPQSNLNFGSAVQRSAAPRQVGGTPAPARPAPEPETADAASGEAGAADGGSTTSEPEATE